MSTEATAVAADEATQRLDQLLQEDVTAAADREKRAFDEAVRGFEKQIVLFGGGGLGRKTLAGMRRLGMEPCAFADNNPRLRGTSIEGVPVYSVAEAAKRFGRSAAFLVTIWNSRSRDRMAQRMQQLREAGCAWVVPVGLFFWKYPDVFLPYFPLDLPHKALPCAADIRKAFQLFRDSQSRREYVGQLEFRLLLNFDRMGWPETVDQYARPDLFAVSPNEVFVDCGAFDGDTLAAFVEQQGESFSKAIAFEPDPLNYEKLQQRIRGFPESIGQKMMVYPYALGARNETLYFDPTGMETSKAGAGPVAVECVTLDETLEPVSPTLIKFDIEGVEPSALEGARRLVTRDRPVLAVSAYHEQAHLWQIPLKLEEICQDYRFFLRPQGTEGWDLICYAVPAERLNRSQTSP